MFIYVNNDKLEFTASNDTLLEFLIKNNYRIKSNCDGNGACGTCHVKIDEEHYNESEISDHELDVLEKQINLTSTSRLACQVKMSPALDGEKIDIL